MRPSGNNLGIAVSSALQSTTCNCPRKLCSTKFCPRSGLCLGKHWTKLLVPLNEDTEDCYEIAKGSRVINHETGTRAAAVLRQLGNTRSTSRQPLGADLIERAH